MKVSNVFPGLLFELACSTAIRAAAVIASVVAVAACGTNESAPAADAGTTQQAGAGDVAQACSVFTLEMARQVLGESARPGEPPPLGSNDDIAGSMCTYEADDPTPRSRFSTVITATVTLNAARTATGRASNRNAFEQWSKGMQGAGEEVETVTGVGEAACYIGGVLNQMYVLVDDGRYALIVSAMDPNGDNRASTEQLATQVVGML